MKKTFRIFIKRALIILLIGTAFFPYARLMAATTEVWNGSFTVTAPEMCMDYSGTGQNNLQIDDSGKMTGSFSDEAGTTGTIAGTVINSKFNYEVSSGGSVIIRVNGDISRANSSATGNFTSFIECLPGSGPLTGSFSAKITSQAIVPPPAPVVKPVVPEPTPEPVAPPVTVDIPKTETPVPQEVAAPEPTFGEKFIGTILSLRENAQVVKITRQVVLPVSVTVGVVSAGALTVTATQGSATIAFNLSQFFRALDVARFYLLAFLRFEKKKPWGRVIDRISGAPIPGATVEIYNADYNKMRDKQLTDSAGRFSGLVGTGSYFVRAVQKGYEPAESQVMDISSTDKLLNLEIALSPVGEFLSSYIKKINLLNAVRQVLNRLSPVFLIFGTLSALAVAIILPTMLNYGLFAVYLVLSSLKFYLSRHIARSFGSISDAATNEPLPLVVLRIFDHKKNWLLATKVSDSLGRYDFLLSPGEYYITCVKSGYAPSRTDAFEVTGTDSSLPSLVLKKSL